MTKFAKKSLARHSCSMLVAVALFCGVPSSEGTSNRSARAVQPSTSREVTADELTGKRGPTEDLLRLKFLAGFADDQTMSHLKVVVNRPWDDAGLQDVANAVLCPRSGTTDKIGYPQLNALANLLVYISTSYEKNSAPAAKARSLYNEILHNLVEATRKDPVAGRNFFALITALEKYGNEDMISLPSVWEALDMWWFRTLYSIELYGNMEALQQLRERRANGNWRDGIEGRFYDEAILIMEERLKHSDASVLSDPGSEHEARVQCASELWCRDNPKASRWIPEAIRNRMTNAPVLNTSTNFPSIQINTPSTESGAAN